MRLVITATRFISRTYPEREPIAMGFFRSLARLLGEGLREKYLELG